MTGWCSYHWYAAPNPSCADVDGSPPQVFSTGLVAIFLLGCDHGMGKHAEFLGMGEVIYGAKVR